MDEKIISDIRAGKIDEAIGLAVASDFSTKVLKFIIDECHFDLLWKLYKKKVDRRAWFLYYIITDFISMGRVDLVDYLYGKKV